MQEPVPVIGEASVTVEKVTETLVNFQLISMLLFQNPINATGLHNKVLIILQQMGPHLSWMIQEMNLRDLQMTQKVMRY